jgi:hypothetical protein
MMNWGAFMGSAFPAALPAQSTIKLIFIVRPQPLRALLRNWPDSQSFIVREYFATSKMGFINCVSYVLK